MESVNINYAYDGFLYAPLFMADNLGIFQKRMSPKYRNGDEATINRLAHPIDPEDGGHNWFAICDPFAKDITAVQNAIGRLDHVCIIDAFIHRLPVWLYYSGGADLCVCNSEADLFSRRADIDQMLCYRRFNTGYLVGDRVKRGLLLSPSKFVECDFGSEFGAGAQPLPPKTLVVTSDILKLIKYNDIDEGRVVFSYGQRVPDLTPFLFTAVFTLKSTIDEHLDAVLSLLNGLRRATNDIKAFRHLDILRRHYSAFTDEEIERAVDALVKEDIYSTDFDLERTATAYANAKAAWKTVKPHASFPEIEMCREPLPCLLLKNGWNKDKVIVDLLVEKWKGDPQLVDIVRSKLPEQPVGSKHHTLTLLAVAFFLAAFAVGSLSCLAEGWEKRAVHGNHVAFLAACLLIFILQMICSVKLGTDYYKENESKGLEVLGGVALTCFLAILGTVLTLAL